LRPLADASDLPRSAPARPWPWAAAPILFCAGVAGASILLILRLNGWIYYTLDDPYIHLALSERIARLQYGINPGEAAAPSSSILWPLLLAPFAGFSWHALVPLVINLAALTATAALLYRLIQRALGGEHPGLSALLAILIAWCGGTLPLVFTGMEHSLHLSVALATVLGLAILVEEGALRPWLPAALIAAPLVRYEAAALSLIAIAAIWISGRRRAAVATAALCALPLTAFTLFLISQGLAPLPGSVLAKAHEALDPGGSLMASLIKTVNFRVAQADERDLLLPFSAMLVAAAVLRQRVWIAAVLCAAALLHFAFGLLTERYVVYLRSLLLLGLAYGLGPQLLTLARRHGAAAVAALLLVASAPLLFESARAISRLPASAQDIRLLQAQARRFVMEEWQGPVAVNDLGQASYRNPHYVLDLWGLGSEEARRARRAGGEGWAGPLLAARDIRLALVFDSWLRSAIPAEWVPIGILRIDPEVVTHMKEGMSFYAHPGAADEAACRMARFAATLPAGVRFHFMAAPEPAACLVTQGSFPDTPRPLGPGA
jgi:hypothetical protein